MSLVLAALYSLHTQNGHPLIPQGGDDKAGDIPSGHTFPAHGSFGQVSASATIGIMVLVKAVKLTHQDNEIPDKAWEDFQFRHFMSMYEPRYIIHVYCILFYSVILRSLIFTHGNNKV